MTSCRDGSVRQHYRYAVSGFAALLKSCHHDDWTRPALGLWTVRDLAGHTSRALLTVESYLEPAHTTAKPDLIDGAAYFQAASAALADREAVAERGRTAGAALGDDPPAAVADMAERVLALVEGSSDDAVVTTPAGTMTLAGYLPTRTFELVVHGLDLATAVDVVPPVELSAALPGCLRLAAGLTASRHDAADVLLALTGRRALPPRFSVV